MSDEEVRVTLVEAARQTGLSVDTFRVAIRRRELSAKYPTAKPMVRMSEVSAWIEAAPDEPRRTRP